MILSCRILEDVADVNHFRYASEVRFTEGDGADIFFQLIDSSQDRNDQGFNPSGRRYAPAAGATLQIVVDTLNDAKKVTRYATQPFANEPSIWKLTLLPTDAIRGTASLRLLLTEGVKVTRGSAIGVIAIDPQATIV